MKESVGVGLFTFVGFYKSFFLSSLLLYIFFTLFITSLRYMEGIGKNPINTSKRAKICKHDCSRAFQGFYKLQGFSSVFGNISNVAMIVLKCVHIQ